MVTVLFNDRTIYLLLTIFGILEATTISLVISQKAKGKRLRGSIFYSLLALGLSFIAAYAIAAANKPYFIDYQKEQQIEIMRKTSDFIKKCSESIDKSNRTYASFGVDKKSGVLPDLNNPPDPYGWVIGKQERDSLLRDAIQLSYDAKSRFSSTTTRILDDIKDFLTVPWAMATVLHLAGTKGDFEVKGMRSKRDRRAFEDLLDSLFYQMQVEINKDRTFRDLLPSLSEKSIEINLNELRYGSDISYKQDLQSLLENAQRDNLDVRLLQIPMKSGPTILRASRTANSTYTVMNKDNLFKSGECFVVVAFLKSLTNDRGDFLVWLYDHGVFIGPEDEAVFAGWVFTPHGKDIHESSTWCARW